MAVEERLQELGLALPGELELPPGVSTVPLNLPVVISAEVEIRP